MKSLALIPVVILVAAALGCGLCRTAGWHPHLHEMVMAGVMMVVAATAGLLPAVLTRSSDAVTVSQAGLAGTVIHMFLAIGLGVLASVAGLVQQQRAFVWWLMLFYWLSLAVLATIMVQLVRAADRSRMRQKSA